MGHRLNRPKLSRPECRQCAQEIIAPALARGARFTNPVKATRIFSSLRILNAGRSKIVGNLIESIRLGASVLKLRTSTVKRDPLSQRLEHTS